MEIETGKKKKIIEVIDEDDNDDLEEIVINSGKKANSKSKMSSSNGNQRSTMEIEGGQTTKGSNGASMDSGVSEKASSTTSSSSASSKSSGKSSLSSLDVPLNEHVITLDDGKKQNRRKAIIAINRQFKKTKDKEAVCHYLVMNLKDKLIKRFGDESEAVRETAVELFVEYIPQLESYGLFSDILPNLPVAVCNHIAKQENDQEESFLEALLELLLLIVTAMAERDATELLQYIENIQVALKAICGFKHKPIRLKCSKILEFLAKNLGQELTSHVNNLLACVLPSLSHQHGPVRVAAIKAITELVICDYNSQENSVKSTLERLEPLQKDGKSQVRMALVRLSGRWLKEQCDRHVFDGEILPFLITGLSDDIKEIRVEAFNLMQEIGTLNTDQKVKMDEDFPQDPSEMQMLPLFDSEEAKTATVSYPVGFLERPNLGIRLQVQNRAKKVLKPALDNLSEWTVESRKLGARQLVSVICILEHLVLDKVKDVVNVLVANCLSEDKQIREDIHFAAKLLGFHLDPSDMLHVMMDSINPVEGQVSVETKANSIAILSSAISGMRSSDVIAPVLSDLLAAIANLEEAADTRLLHELIHIIVNIIRIAGEKCEEESYVLFKLLMHLQAPSVPEETREEAKNGLKQFQSAIQSEDISDLYRRHAPDLLKELAEGCSSWVASNGKQGVVDALIRNTIPSSPETLSDCQPILEQIWDTCLIPTNKAIELKIQILETMLLLASSEAAGNLDWNHCLQDVLLPNSVWKHGKQPQKARQVVAETIQVLFENGVAPALEVDQMDEFVTRILGMTEGEGELPQTNLAAFAVLQSLFVTEECKEFLRDDFDNHHQAINDQLYKRFYEEVNNSDIRVRLATFETAKKFLEVTPLEFVKGTTCKYLMERYTIHLTQDSVQSAAEGVMRVVGGRYPEVVIDCLKEQLGNSSYSAMDKAKEIIEWCEGVNMDVE